MIIYFRAYDAGTGKDSEVMLLRRLKNAYGQMVTQKNSGNHWDGMKVGYWWKFLTLLRKRTMFGGSCGFFFVRKGHV